MQLYKVYFNICFPGLKAVAGSVEIETLAKDENEAEDIARDIFLSEYSLCLSEIIEKEKDDESNWQTEKNSI